MQEYLRSTVWAANPIIISPIGRIIRGVQISGLNNKVDITILETGDS